MDWLVLLGGLAILVLGGELLVKGAVGIAVKLNISMLVVGLTVVAFGTSAPELFISLTAAFSGHDGISIGNIVGSNIYNISLILGAATLIFPIKPESQSIRFDWPVMMGSSILLLVFVYNGMLERFEGIILFLLLVCFVSFLIYKSRKEEVEVESEVKPNVPRDVLLVVIGSIALMLGADWFLQGAVGISKQFGLSDQVIGLTIVALGTSMPELVTSVMASLKKRTDISIGNLIGSNIFNVLAVGGVTSMVKPIQIHDIDSMLYNIFWMLGISLLLFPLMYFGKNISRFKGLILLFVFGLYTYLLLK